MGARILNKKLQIYHLARLLDKYIGVIFNSRKELEEFIKKNLDETKNYKENKKIILEKLGLEKKGGL